MKNLFFTLPLLLIIACTKKDDATPVKSNLPDEYYTVSVDDNNWLYDTSISKYYGDSELQLFALKPNMSNRIQLSINIPPNIKPNDVLTFQTDFFIAYENINANILYGKGGSGTLTITRIDKDEAGNTYYGGTFEVTTGSHNMGDQSTVTIKGSFYQNFGITT